MLTILVRFIGQNIFEANHPPEEKGCLGSPMPPRMAHHQNLKLVPRKTINHWRTPSW